MFGVIVSMIYLHYLSEYQHNPLFHDPIRPKKIPCAWSTTTVLKHDAPTAMFRCRNCVFGVEGLSLPWSNKSSIHVPRTLKTGLIRLKELWELVFFLFFFINPLPLWAVELFLDNDLDEDSSWQLSVKVQKKPAQQQSPSRTSGDSC